MRDPFAGYDAWLERPYQDMIEESDRYYDFCEEHDFDPDSPEAEAAYEEFCEEMYDYEPDYDYDEIEEMEWGGIDDGW